MRQKIYNFNKKIGYIGDVKYEVSDYFQFYHTGIEKLIDPDMLLITQRHNNERSEVLAYELLENTNLSDTILAINNDVYLWDSPYDNDMFETVIDVLLAYIRKEHKVSLNPSIQSRYEEIAREHVTIDDTVLRNVIIPKKEFIQKVSRIIKDELKTRIVE